MKIKWNWGTKLFIFTAIFMLFLIGFFIMMSLQTFHLVEKDYYPKALEFQQQIDKNNNTKLLDERVRIENRGEYIEFEFQSFFNPDSIKGDIIFYRPSESREDLKIPIQPDSTGKQFYPVKNLLKGKYIVKIEYYYENKGYYQEDPVLVKMY